MSDADDQMGGTGGETGPRPRSGEKSEGAAARPPGEGTGQQPERSDDRVNEESEESFPASDPPANY